MPEPTPNLFSSLIDAQGLLVSDARRPTIEATIARQIAIERRATAALPFEAEPAVFTRVLVSGAR